VVIKKVRQYNLADIMSNNGFELKKPVKENINKDLVIINQLSKIYKLIFILLIFVFLFLFRILRIRIMINIKKLL
jgi:hypothetical protein